MLSLLCTFVVLTTYATAVDDSAGDNRMIYGVCYQIDATDVPIAIIPFGSAEDEDIDFEDDRFAFNMFPGAAPIDCMWFDNDFAAHSATAIDPETVQKNFIENQDAVQSNEGGQIVCWNQEILIALNRNSSIGSNHLCSEDCPSCIVSGNAALSYEGSSGVAEAALMIPSVFGISGLIVAFVVLGGAIYCLGERYRRWNKSKAGDETEQIVDEVLDEIAKYTIGDYDDEEGFDGDDSDRTESSTECDEELGLSILRVISMNPQDPEIPNPSLYSSGDDGSESDEEQCREDLMVAKETLYAASLGSGNPFESVTPSLKTIEEKTVTVVERKVTINRTGCGRVDVNDKGHHKQNQMLSGGESSDCKISSSADAAGNSSDLP